MFKFKLASLFIIASIGLVISVSAAATPVYGVVNMGLDFGGDELVRVVYVNGDTNKVMAGEGLYFSGGIGMSSNDGKYEGQATLGWKYRGVSGSNGDLNWTRYPLEVLGYTNFNKIRFGGGVTYHLNPVVKGSGILAGKAEFDNALGFVLEAQYRLTDALLVGGRMTMIDYKIDGESFDGSSLGMSLTFQFAK